MLVRDYFEPQFLFLPFEIGSQGTMVYSQPRHSTRDFNQTQSPTKYIAMGVF